MKKIFLPLVLSGIISLGFQSVNAQSIGDIFNKVSGGSSNTKSGTQNSNSNSKNNGLLGSGLSNTDIASGLKEALKVGAQNATTKLSATNGFFANQAIKILLPPEAQQVERTLRSVGMGSLVDKAILSMNRAAEDASKKAAPIFINAITSISIEDGLNILRGGNNAATNYLMGKTTSSLTAAFSPVIKTSLDKVGAPALWKSVFSAYNKISIKKVNPDLTGYVTERALSGLFTTIGSEEAKIRANPLGQASSIIQKVFGS
ncbi:DUF4197 domain-containing protein [Taibaiella lutea]|uniref:DUF4197 domain-containing protein n=1 Tax=Taibaiella lutea TaxID=2608001 RepID=A0A5M6CH21_9BACT|nr:DUF4197 domain-containing protein [Taibaiella lutea]KAA5533720.1 DUF4197 domain-containing protein [Taibaiella lutea]